MYLSGDAQLCSDINMVSNLMPCLLTQDELKKKKRHSPAPVEISLSIVAPFLLLCGANISTSVCGPIEEAAAGEHLCVSSGCVYTQTTGQAKNGDSHKIEPECIMKTSGVG